MTKLEQLQKRKDKCHKRNGQIIDMMNEGKLSVADAKEMLKISSDECERITELIQEEQSRILTYSSR